MSQPPKRKNIIAIGGLIGSGKSVVADAIYVQMEVLTNLPWFGVSTSGALIDSYVEKYFPSGDKETLKSDMKMKRAFKEQHRQGLIDHGNELFNLDPEKVGILREAVENCPSDYIVLESFRRKEEIKYLSEIHNTHFVVVWAPDEERLWRGVPLDKIVHRPDLETEYLYAYEQKNCHRFENFWPQANDDKESISLMRGGVEKLVPSLIRQL